MKTLGGHMDNIQLPAEVRDHKTLEMTAACGVTAPQHSSANAVRGEKQQIGDMGLGSEQSFLKQDLCPSHRGSTSEAFFKEADTSTHTPEDSIPKCLHNLMVVPIRSFRGSSPVMPSLLSHH